MHRKFAVGALCVLLLISVGLGQATNVPEPPAVSAADLNAPRKVNESYRLCSHDRVSIRVFREDELATEARIDKNGTITFPLIGNVRLVGQTAQQAAKTIERLLAADYLVDPQVSVSVTEYSKRRFTILGQVSSPGTIEMPEDTPLNLLEAIGMAGGYTRIAQPSRITVKRVVDGKEVVHKLDGKKMAKDTNTEIFQVLPGDTITVGESIF
jgi:protein involved in polysaccharide export with SLBB domain